LMIQSQVRIERCCWRTSMEPCQQVKGLRDDTQFNAPKTRVRGFASSIIESASLCHRDDVEGVQATPIGSPDTSNSYLGFPVRTRLNSGSHEAFHVDGSNTNVRNAFFVMRNGNASTCAVHFDRKNDKLRKAIFNGTRDDYKAGSW